MLAELGPLSYYQNAKQLIKIAGTNPTESESTGKRGNRTPMSKKGRPVQSHPLKKREVIGATANRLLRLAYVLVRKQFLCQVPQMAEVTA